MRVADYTLTTKLGLKRFGATIDESRVHGLEHLLLESAVLVSPDPAVTVCWFLLDEG